MSISALGRYFTDTEKIQNIMMETGLVTSIDLMLTYPGVKPKHPHILALERLLAESETS